MRERLNQILEWFLDLHPLAKVTWFMGVFVVLLFSIPLLFGENLVKGDPEERTARAANTLRQLEQATGKTPRRPNYQTTSELRERHRNRDPDDEDPDDQDNEEEDNENDYDNSGSRSGGDTDL